MRDIKDASAGYLSKAVATKLNGMRTLGGKLKDMKEYLEGVIQGKYKYNSQIIENL
jgi:hypothetical protein